MPTIKKRGLASLCAAAFLIAAGAALVIVTIPAQAQKHGQGGARGGHTTEHLDHADSEHTKGKKGPGGPGGAIGKPTGSRASSLRDIFRDMESDVTADRGSEKSAAPTTKGRSTVSKGRKGSASSKKTVTTSGSKKTTTTKGHTKSTDVAEDSDRPPWAGTPGRDGKPGKPNTQAGTKRGDLFGDMYVLLRDANGVPIMIQLADGTWVVQPVDANGNPLPLDAEGNLINPELAVEVGLDRLNVGRSPLRVLSSQYDEALKTINSADTITIDAVGRIVVTTDGVVKTLDSPLVNLALYTEIMNTGTLTGVTADAAAKFPTSVSYLVDGTYTVADLTSAAAFLAAAADKTSTLTIDKVVYMNSILGITGTLTDQVSKTYVDYSTYNYDRATTYSDVTVTVLVKQPDGSYLPQTVNVYDAVFNNVNYTSSDGGVDGFAQAADDALQVIDYIHNYSVPVEPVTN